MYTVVGCPDCRKLWIREAGGKRTTCPSCRSSHAVERLRILFRSDSIDAARDARTQLLAERVDADAADFSSLTSAVSEPLIDDEEQLTAAGIDPDSVAEASTESPRSGDQLERVKAAIEKADPATEEAIIERATASGVPESTVRSHLDRLRSAGELTRESGEYRLL